MRNRVIFSVILLHFSMANAVILLPGKIENAVRADMIVSKKYQAKKAFIEKSRQNIKAKFNLNTNKTAKNIFMVAPEPVSATTVTLIAPKAHEELPRGAGDDSLKSDSFSKGLSEIKQSSQGE